MTSYYDRTATLAACPPNNEYAILARLFQYDIQLLLQHNELLGIGIVEREKLWRPPLQNKMN